MPPTVAAAVMAGHVAAWEEAPIAVAAVTATRDEARQWVEEPAHKTLQEEDQSPWVENYHLDDRSSVHVK